jgi:hypothetical protein
VTITAVALYAIPHWVVNDLWPAIGSWFSPPTGGISS